MLCGTMLCDTAFCGTALYAVGHIVYLLPESNRRVTANNSFGTVLRSTLTSTVSAVTGSSKTAVLLMCVVNYCFVPLMPDSLSTVV